MPAFVPVVDHIFFFEFEGVFEDGVLNFLRDVFENHSRNVPDGGRPLPNDMTGDVKGLGLRQANGEVDFLTRLKRLLGDNFYSGAA